MAVILDGDASNDELVGSNGSDILNGLAGNDVLFGLSGADILFGGDGDDILNGGDTPLISNESSVVYRLYLATLGREPDEGGLVSWVSAIQNGAIDQSDAAAGFVNSAEFQSIYGALNDQAFVELLYNNVLNRSSDPAGLQAWLDVLNSGTSRADVVLGFSNSPEFISNTQYPAFEYFNGLIEGNLGAVFRAYGAILGRLPDAPGYISWLNSLDTDDLSLQQVIDGFTGSNEFQSVYGTLSDAEFVTLLYNNVLARDPDQAGLDNWLSAMQNGASRAEVVLGFSESQEFVLSTRAAFQDFIAATFPQQSDTLIGGRGNDTLFGGRGSDTFVFDVTHTGSDTVYGLDEFDSVEFTNFGYLSLDDISARLTQSGNDVIFSDQGVIVTFTNISIEELQALLVLEALPTGTPSDDVLVGDDLDNDIDGGDGNDTIAGSGGNDSLNGDEGDDVITGGAGTDTLSGGAGDDILTGGGGDDILSGGAGADTFIFSPDMPGNYTVTDLDADDVIDFNAFGYATTNDAMSFMMQVGSDVVFSDGTISITFSDVTLAEVAAAIDLPEIINGDVGDNVLEGTDKDSTINGSGGQDILTGNGGNDTLNGGDGRDTMNGGLGNDVLTGGFGNDTFVFDVTDPGQDTVTDLSAGDIVQLIGFGYLSISDAEGRLVQDGNDVVFNDQGVTILFEGVSIADVVNALNLPNVVNGNENDNNLDGTDGFDIVNGFGGDDVLHGFADADQLNGGDGNDSLYGDDGADDLNGGAGDDTLYVDFSDTYDGGEGVDTVILVPLNENGFSIDLATRNVEIVFASNLDDILDGTRALTSIELNGLSGNDELTGSDFSDRLFGGDGDDVVVGNAGDDFVEGGRGSDTITGGLGVDTLDGGSDDDTLFGGEGDDVLLGGNGNDTLNGENGFDFLDGGSGTDTLLGGDGGDVLVGGYDADILTGGGGTDVFTFNIGDSLIGAEDIITDMVAGERLVFGTHTFVGENDFSASGVFEVRYIAGPTTIVELDRNGDGVADEAIQITGELDFTSDGQELTVISQSPDSIDGWMG